MSCKQNKEESNEAKQTDKSIFISSVTISSPSSIGITLLTNDKQENIKIVQEFNKKHDTEYIKLSYI